MNASNRREVAARLRALLAGQDNNDLAQSARRLGVEEVSLRMSIDEESPFPTIDVMIAMISAYGVDANWLLTGKYDATTHRRVMEADARVVGEIIRKLATEAPTTSVSEPVDEPHRLHIA